MYIKNSSKIALTYVGAIVGAGFATGQEIYQFFTTFGIKGQLGGLISTIGFIIFGFIYLKIVFNNPIENYYDMLKLICGKKVAKVFDICISMFLLGSFVIMIAAAYTIISTYIVSDRLVAYLIIATILWVSLSKGAKGMVNINFYLIPILVIVVVILSVFSLVQGVQVFSSGGLVPSNFVFSAITYVSYNLIIGMVVLSSLKTEIYNKKTIILAPIISGLVLGVMLILIISATQLIKSPSELPIIDLAYGVHKCFKMLLVLGIGIAILTSALASGFGLVNRMQQATNLRYNVLVVTIILVAIPLSLWGFSSLVGFVYPFFGFINLVIMLLSVRYYFMSHIKGFYKGIK